MAKNWRKAVLGKCEPYHEFEQKINQQTFSLEHVVLYANRQNFSCQGHKFKQRGLQKFMPG
jgi:hypothetical protein